jgi:hypothetical protein
MESVRAIYCRRRGAHTATQPLPDPHRHHHPHTDPHAYSHANPHFNPHHHAHPHGRAFGNTGHAFTYPQADHTFTYPQADHTFTYSQAIYIDTHSHVDRTTFPDRYQDQNTNLDPDNSHPNHHPLADSHPDHAHSNHYPAPHHYANTLSEFVIGSYSIQEASS